MNICWLLFQIVYSRALWFLLAWSEQLEGNKVATSNSITKYFFIKHMKEVQGFTLFMYSNKINCKNVIKTTTNFCTNNIFLRKQFFC